MDRLCRFIGKPITIDGKDGILVPPIEFIKIGHRYETRYNGSPDYKDSHYRFIWREYGGKCDVIVEKIVSANTLRPAEEDEPHGHRRLRTIEGTGIVGRIQRSYIEQPMLSFQVDAKNDGELTKVIESCAYQLEKNKTRCGYDSMLRSYGL
ncbi:hypothetical protein J4206_02630 [Candidatus Woesearchaeota archaeon]|nr:hypothetical protein [Candidatus Woesearchaeota archaeon]